MPKAMKFAAALFTVLALSASAMAEECVPQQGKDLEGNIAFTGFVRRSVASMYFESNGCSWNGNDQLNGTDAYVFDIAGLDGHLTLTLIGGPVGLQSRFEAVLLDEGCERVGDTIEVPSSSPDFPQPFEIPVAEGAMWMLIQGRSDPPVSSNFMTDVSITVHWEGKECSPVAEPKPKKKRKH